MNAQPKFCSVAEAAEELGLVCSSCKDTIRVDSPAPGTTLLDLHCPRCGAADVYHVLTLRRLAPSSRRPDAEVG